MSFVSPARELDRSFWEIYRSVMPDDDLKPTNLESEKDEFLKCVEKGIPRNPMFTYRKPASVDYVEQLSILIDQASSLRTEPYFVPLAVELSEWVNQFSKRGEGFSEWLYSVYGKPSRDLLENARETLGSLGQFKAIVEEGRSAAEASRHFSTVLSEMRLEDWTIELVSMPAKVSINAPDKTVFINRSATFSESELHRLSVHEIGTHVLRYENGSKQDYDTFRFGFANYLACEEGLAIYAEKITNQLTNFDLGKYCLRVLACDLASTCDFCEVFDAMQPHVSNDLAFLIALRVKRGLVDTSQPFGYTKDQVYLAGYRRIRRMPLRQIKQLYVGKIGFTELDNLDFQTLNLSAIRYPKWIQ